METEKLHLASVPRQLRADIGRWCSDGTGINGSIPLATDSSNMYFSYLCITRARELATMAIGAYSQDAAVSQCYHDPPLTFFGKSSWRQSYDSHLFLSLFCANP